MQVTSIFLYKKVVPNFLDGLCRMMTLILIFTESRFEHVGKIWYMRVTFAMVHQLNILESSIDIPQGSVLGPLLYIIYVNHFWSLNAILYADDKSIVINNSKTTNLAARANEHL